MCGKGVRYRDCVRLWAHVHVCEWITSYTCEHTHRGSTDTYCSPLTDTVITPNSGAQVVNIINEIQQNELARRNCHTHILRHTSLFLPPGGRWFMGVALLLWKGWQIVNCQGLSYLCDIQDRLRSLFIPPSLPPTFLFSCQEEKQAQSSWRAQILRFLLWHFLFFVQGMHSLSKY